jgi:hypothetical protein
MTISNLLSDEEKLRFDLKGFILFPAVLSADEIRRLKDQVDRIRTDPESLPPAERQLPGGAVSMLIDHPAVMRVLRTIIEEDVEKIRLENAFVSHRDKGEARWSPHAGGRTLNPNYSYQYHDGRIYAGMTRVVWELNAVREGGGGTSFIPGSHKSNFRKLLPLLDDPGSGVWETYGCPPGSLLVFSEAVRHSAVTWNQNEPREAIFFAYNHINVRHHKPTLTPGLANPEVLRGLSAEHRRFFQDVYHPQFDRQAASE